MRSHKSNGRKTTQGTGETLCVARIFRFLPDALSPLMKTGERVGRRARARFLRLRGPSAETALSPSLPLSLTGIVKHGNRRDGREV